jgi:hypothetical protein
MGDWKIRIASTTGTTLCPVHRMFVTQGQTPQGSHSHAQFPFIFSSKICQLLDPASSSIRESSSVVLLSTCYCSSNKKRISLCNTGSIMFHINHCMQLHVKYKMKGLLFFSMMDKRIFLSRA